LARPEIAEKLIGPVRAHTNAPITYYTHDLHHVRLAREAEIHGDPKLRTQAALMAETECAIFRNVDHVMSPSEDEADVIRQLAPDMPVTVLPPYYYEWGEIQARDVAHFADLTDIVFVGGFPHSPNVDAALFIAREIMPIVWHERPDARLVLVGYAPPPEVCSLACSRIVVTGQVLKVEPFLDRARVVLAALRYGAGVKGKVVDALRQGVPVVTTRVGAEGIGIEPGRDAIVADSAIGLADGVLELFRDPARCAALSTAGIDLVRKRFSRAAARAAIGKVFQTPRCGICGSGNLIVPEGGFREAVVCRNCYALGRAEALGRVVLSRLAHDGEASLAELAARKPDIRVHEFGFVGGVADTLRGEPWFTVSDYFDGIPVGTLSPSGIRCEDLTHLTFADSSFDLVISQDVMEHVPDPLRGFTETARILRPGGSYIFTITQNPALPKSVQRARLSPDGVEYFLPPEYHDDPIRDHGALVFTDFGADVGTILQDAGLHLIVHELPVFGGSTREIVRVFEAVKPAIDNSLPSAHTIAGLPDMPEIGTADALFLADLQDRAGAFETLIQRCYTAELRRGATAIDGGANYGRHTSPMACCVGPRGRIHAFEPLPFAAAELRRMFADQSQVTVHEKALAERSGTATFHHIVNDAALSSLLDRDLKFANPGLQTQKLQIVTTTLDQFSDEPVDFIKLDLEGYDYHALIGGRDLLLRQRPIVAFEFGRRDAATPAGYGPDEFFGFFEDLDFEIFDLFGRRFGRAEFDLPWNAREMPHYVVAVPTERTEVAARLRKEAWALIRAEASS
jgi:FkbM family methyltransferase